MGLSLLHFSRFFIYLALLTPLLVSSQFFAPYIAAKMIFFRAMTELALLFFIFGLTRAPGLGLNKRLVRQPLFLAVLAFAAIFVLTAFTAVNPQLAFWSNFERGEGAWQMLHYLLFFILTAVLFNSRRQWLGLLRWQTIIASLVSAYALLQLWPGAASWVLAANAAPGGTWGNPSFLAGYLLFGIFFAGWLVFNEKNFLTKGCWGLTGLLQIFTLLVTKNRSAIIALVVGLVATFLYLAHRSNWSYKSSRTYWIIGFALLLFLIAGSGFWISQVRGDVLTGLQPRLLAWQMAGQAILEKPLLGWGVENFPYAFDKYYNPKLFGIDTFFDRAHNLYLDYLLMGGLPLLLAYLALHYFLLWPPTILFIMSVMQLVNGLAIFELISSYLPLFLFLAFALNFRLGFSQNQPVQWQRPLEWLMAPLAALLIAASLYLTAWRPLQKNLLLAEAVDNKGKKPGIIINQFIVALDYPSLTGQAETNRRLHLFTLDYLNWALEQLEKGAAGEDIRADVNTIIGVNREWFEKDRAGFRSAADFYVYGLVLIEAAEATGEPGYLEEAREIISQGRQRAPKEIEFIALNYKLGTVTADEGLQAAALAELQKLRPDLSQADLNFVNR